MLASKTLVYDLAARLGHAFVGLSVYNLLLAQGAQYPLVIYMDGDGVDGCCAVLGLLFFAVTERDNPLGCVNASGAQTNTKCIY